MTSTLSSPTSPYKTREIRDTAVYLDLMAGPSDTPPDGRTSSASTGSASGGLVVEQTMIVKTIIVDGKTVSKKALVLEPVRVRDLGAGENHYPLPPDHSERREVGRWRQFLRAVRSFGFGDPTT